MIDPIKKSLAKKTNITFGIPKKSVAVYLYGTDYSNNDNVFTIRNSSENTAQ